jgi:hypothetical protein
MDRSVFNEIIKNDKIVDYIFLFLFSSSLFFSIIISLFLYAFDGISVLKTFFISIISIGLLYLLIFLILINIKYENIIPLYLYIFFCAIYYSIYYFIKFCYEISNL